VVPSELPSGSSIASRLSRLLGTVTVAVGMPHAPSAYHSDFIRISFGELPWDRVC
jgi:hypothetical protein